MDKSKRWALLVIVLLVFFGVYGCSSPADPDPIKDTYPQKFYVKGNAIVDETGKEFVFRGLDMVAITSLKKANDRNDDEYIIFSKDIFDEMNSWGSKITRIQIGPIEWRENREEAFQLIDQVIEWSRENKMYIYIQYNIHGFPPTESYPNENNETTQAEFEVFWDEISSKYKNENAVAFYELMNEPTGTDELNPTTQDWLLWKVFAENLIDIIRENDPESIIMVNGLHWGYDISYVETYPIERTQIIYGTHPYPGQHQYKSWDIAFGDISDRYPVFASEFGYDVLSFAKIENFRNELLGMLPQLQDIYNQYDNGYLTLEEFAQNILNEIQNNEQANDYYEGVKRQYENDIKYYLEDKGIGWTAFCFSTKYRPKLIENRNYDATKSGEFFKEWLQETN